MAFLIPVIPSLLASLAVSAAAYAATMLLTPKPKSGFVSDNSPTILTDRGSYLPYLIGRRRVPGFLCWAGDREVRGGGGGGGKGGGGGGGSPPEYWEAGMQVLCLGPASRLTKIVESGKVIWEGDINPSTTPAGSHLQTKSGDAYIYWGEMLQPVDPVLSGEFGPERTGTAVGGGLGSGWHTGRSHTINRTSAPPDNTASDGIGVASRWPGICYVLWNKHKNGGNPQWPAIEYELTVPIPNSPLTGSDSWLEEETAGDGRDGPNPAHVLWQLLTAPAPWGFAIAPENLDVAAFEALGVLCQTEHQPCHIFIDQGMSGVDAVGEILTDLGAVMPQIGDVVTIYPIRREDPESVVVVTKDVTVAPAPPTVEIVHSAAVASRLIFTLSDQTNAFRDVTIMVKDDGQERSSGHTKPITVQIPTVISRKVAHNVIDRRAQELLTNLQKMTFDVGRGAARGLFPGLPFVLESTGQQLRVATIGMNTKQRTARIEAVVDQYAGQPDTFISIDDANDYGIIDIQSAEPDAIDVVEELPWGVFDDPALGIYRVRAHRQVATSLIWTSKDGSTYRNIDTQNGYAAGGTLTSSMTQDASTIIEEGPTFTTFNSDIANVLDLSGDEISWRTGLQICRIGTEYFFLRNVTALGGGSYRLDGLIRARFDTSKVPHAGGDVVIIAQQDAIKAIKTALIRKDSSFYVKVQPAIGKDAADLSTCTAIPVTIASPRQLRPLPPDNFFANRVPAYSINLYHTGGDVAFTWTYRVKEGGGRAASEVDAGDAIAAGKPPHEGKFRVRILASSLVVKHEELIDDDTGTWTYTHAQLMTDFGAEPAFFYAQLTNVNGAYESITRQITVTLS